MPKPLHHHRSYYQRFRIYGDTIMQAYLLLSGGKKPHEIKAETGFDFDSQTERRLRTKPAGEIKKSFRILWDAIGQTADEASQAPTQVQMQNWIPQLARCDEMPMEAFDLASLIGHDMSINQERWAIAKTVFQDHQKQQDEVVTLQIFRLAWKAFSGNDAPTDRDEAEELFSNAPEEFDIAGILAGERIFAKKTFDILDYAKNYDGVDMLNGRLRMDYYIPESFRAGANGVLLDSLLDHPHFNGMGLRILSVEEDKAGPKGFIVHTDMLDEHMTIRRTR